MAKKDKYEKMQDQEVAALLREIDGLYSDLAATVGFIGATSASGVDTSVPFVLSEYPAIKARIDKAIARLAKKLEVAIVNGIRSQWTLANKKNDELCRVVFGNLLDSITSEQRRRYFNNNDRALDAFLLRRESGLSLSQRVWNYARQGSLEIESALELGIKTGQSAAEMARDLKDYLHFPDKLFRRVRDKEGELHLSKAAAEFHPGQGVYRSSYKNARRLAATETNMAYRSADHARHMQLDFIVGIRINLSNNHTCLGKDGKPHPFYDICDELQGDYPKTFDFVGWHPLCRCFVTTILKTDEEIDRDSDGVDRGSVNEVKKMPPQWEEWLEKNQDRIDRAEARGTLPYFLRDNEWAWKDGESQATVGYKEKTALQIAEERHSARTPEQIDAIKTAWRERAERNSPLSGMIGRFDVFGIEYNDVSPLPGKLEIQEIIARISGGDMTNGSCASSAFAYAANRSGWDVLDFRGGQSQYRFSLSSNLMEIAESVGGIVNREFNDYKNADTLLSHILPGKEYFFVCGEHAAIVRKSASGYEYLELQSEIDNGFRPLNNFELKNRFSAKKSRTHYRQKIDRAGCLVDIDLFKNDTGFRKLMGYINTDPGKQMKGVGGGKK